MTKVLVIDDEKGTLRMFGMLLRAYGYEVLIAEDGMSGLAIAEQEKPPIVFTDIKMPGMDGLEVLKRLKEIDPKTEVVVMTGHGDMDLAVRALNLNATDFIDKPIQRSALEAALARAEERLRRAGARENRVDLRQAGPVLILDIVGSLTSDSEKMLDDAFREAVSRGADRILLHFEETASINGAGIGLLIQLLTEGKQRGQRIGIYGISDNLAKVLDMVGLGRLAGIFEDEESALQGIDNSE